MLDLARNNAGELRVGKDLNKVSILNTILMDKSDEIEKITRNNYLTTRKMGRNPFQHSSCKSLGLKQLDTIAGRQDMM
jgi:hypothetical protein